MSVRLFHLPDPLNLSGLPLAETRATRDLAAMQDRLDQLCDIVHRHAARPRLSCALPRVTLYKNGASSQPVCSIYPPMTALILRGAKEVAVGDRRLRYDPASYFVAAVELPAFGCVKLDRPDETYLAVSLELDGDRLGHLLAQTGEPPAPTSGDAAFAVTPVTAELLNAWLRLLRLLDTPGDIAVLAPLCEQEILYRLLQGPQGAMLRQITQADSRLSQVRRAVALIRARYDEPLRIEALAEHAGMSPASLHRHFKTATAMSPLQYQKSLRLQEARRLLASGREVAASAYAVGYESASQFSREYTRMFSTPPSRDLESLSSASGRPPVKRHDSGARSIRSSPAA